MAKQHDVPLVENPPLARTLYASVEIDEEIPHNYYQAVADIIWLRHAVASKIVVALRFAKAAIATWFVRIGYFVIHEQY